MTTSEATKRIGFEMVYSSKHDGILANARAWNWTAVSRGIESAYAALGAVAPACGSGEGHSSGYAFHCGEHPLSQAMADAKK